MNKNAIGSKVNKGLINVVLLFFSLSCIFPVIWMIYSSFKTNKEFNNNILSLPSKLRLDNYISAWVRSHFGIYVQNSFLYAIISMAIILVITFVIGYFISRYKFPGRNVVYILFLFGMLVPIHSLLVPIFIQFRNLGLYDKRITLIFPYVGFGLPFAIFLIESYIKGIPKELEEAAFIDGSSLFRTMFTIIMPICNPVLTTAGILNFFSIWNEFPFALILVKSDRLKTISLGLKYFAGEYTTDYTQQMAAIVLATIPVILIYLAFYKRIIQGMTAGAVKG